MHDTQFQIQTHVNQQAKKLYVTVVKLVKPMSQQVIHNIGIQYTVNDMKIVIKHFISVNMLKGNT